MAQPAPVPHLIEPEEGVSQVTDDITCLSLPIPFDVGTVNCYLLLGDPLTLVDTGSRIGYDINDLAETTRRAGVELDQLELLILTHRHVDHFGLAAEVHERSGCQVVASVVDGPFMAKWEGMVIGSREQLRRQGRSFGIPEELFSNNERWVRAITAAARAVDSDRLVRDGDVVRAGGRDWRVIECPGHTEGLVTFFHEESGVLLANDHVLRHITPNPDVYNYDPDHLHSGLPDYIASLKKVRDLPASLVLPGHGYEMTDLKGRVADILRHHDIRAQKVHDIVRAERNTVFGIAEQVWPSLRPQDSHLAVREIIGHLVLLLQDGRVDQRWEGDVLLFSAT
jgi:glyoxylase-like metal-dependent hydrolase (beta-lactamase superfamily II)